MKRKFGALLVLSTALILTSCGDKVDPLKEAADYYYQTLKDDTTSLKSYELNSKLVLAGVTYNVSWELSVTKGNADNVTLGAVNDKGMYPVTVVYDPDSSYEEVHYTIKATLTDAEGNKEVLSFDRVVPAFKYATLKEFKEAVKDKSEEVLNVSGVVTAIYKSGVYVQNEAGEGFYAYKPDFTPMTKDALLAEYPLGTEVIVSGTATEYNGQLEFNSGCAVKKMGAAAADFEIPYADKTEAYTNYSDTENTIGDLVNSVVEIKGAKLGKIDTNQHYYYFTVGSNEYYVRPSDSYNTFTLKDGDANNVNNVVKDWQVGYTATIRGLAGVYGGKYYVTPLEMDAVEITGKELTTATKLELALAETADLFKDAFAANAQVALPVKAQGEAYNTVDLAYTLSDDTPAANFAIAEGKLNVTIPQDGNDVKGKITVTASLAGETKFATYELVAKFPTPSTIAAFVDAKDKTNFTFLEGTVTAVNKVGEAGAFVLSDATSSVFSYSGANVALGDKVLVKGVYGENYGTPQLSDVTVIKTISTGNDVVAASGTPVSYTAKEIYDVVVAEAEDNAKIAGLYEGKYFAVSGYLYVDGDYTNLATTAENVTSKTKAISLYKNKDIDVSALVGQEVIVYGFYRGHNLKNDYLTLQVQSIVAKTAGGETGGEQGGETEKVEKTLTLSVSTLGLASESYVGTADQHATATVEGVALEFQQLGNYGDGLQLRDKASENKTSIFWNTAALSGNITKIELTYSSTKDTYDNPDMMIWSFGNSTSVDQYTTKLSTVAGTKTYTITPNAETYTYFKMEYDYGFSSYWESIVIYYK